jgi:hypothetical protein
VYHNINGDLPLDLESRLSLSCPDISNGS